MRNLIESLDEAITNPIAVIGKYPEEPLEVNPKPEDFEPAESELDDGEQVDEAVSATVISKMAEAMVSSPRLGQFLSKAVKGSTVTEDQLRQAILAHVRGILPLAMSDAGANVQKALAGRARRQVKAVGQGKSALEAEEMTDDQFAEAELETELDAELDRD